MLMMISHSKALETIFFTCPSMLVEDLPMSHLQKPELLLCHQPEQMNPNGDDVRELG
jgi:hypothetical protein